MTLLTPYTISGGQAQYLVEESLSVPLGIVIINLQQTRLDGAASLRMFAESDLVMRLLTERLGLRYQTPRVRLRVRVLLYENLNVQIGDSVMKHGLIPYDKDGSLSDRFFSCLDLTAGNKIKLHSNSSKVKMYNEY